MPIGIRFFTNSRENTKKKYIKIFPNQFRRKTTYPSVCIEKTKVRHGSAPLAKVLAKMSAIEVSHRKEITMLRAELDEYKNKCENLQQQLAMYQAREKNQQCK